jgi:folate-dependent phosphoribosylglycinamide formyltransferase PurN
MVVYSSEHYMQTELFKYIYAHLAAMGWDTRLVVVRSAEKPWFRSFWRRARKFFRLGLLPGIEVMTSLWLQRGLGGRDEEEVARRLRALARPDCCPEPDRVVHVQSTNGPDAVETLRKLQPDVVVQAGAGLLKSQVFTIPRLGTLNLHHGIAPLIRGMNSIYWGLWENRPDWIGSTVHRIDEGIDTGTPLAYFRVEPISPGERFPSLFVRATDGGVANLVRVVQGMKDGTLSPVVPCPGEGTYRSTFSGWKMLLLERRLRKMRQGVVP